MGFPMRSSSAQPGMPLRLKQLSFSLSISLGLSVRGEFCAPGSCCARAVPAANKIKTKTMHRTEPPLLSCGSGAVGMEKRRSPVNVGADFAFGFQRAGVDGQDGGQLLGMLKQSFAQVQGLRLKKLAGGPVVIVGALLTAGNKDGIGRCSHGYPPRWKNGTSESGRIWSVSKSRNELEFFSRTVRLASPLRKKLVTVPGIQACSKMRALAPDSVPGTAVPLGMYGDTRIAGTRMPRRSKLKVSPVPVLPGSAK